MFLLLLFFETRDAPAVQRAQCVGSGICDLDCEPSIDVEAKRSVLRYSGIPPEKETVAEVSTIVW